MSIQWGANILYLSPCACRHGHTCMYHMSFLLGPHLPPASSSWLFCPCPHSPLPGGPELSLWGPASELGRQRAQCGWCHGPVCSCPSGVRPTEGPLRRCWTLSPSALAHSHCPGADLILQVPLLLAMWPWAGYLPCAALICIWRMTSIPSRKWQNVLPQYLTPAGAPWAPFLSGISDGCSRTGRSPYAMGAAHPSDWWELTCAP
jgi:hypothetical protein